MAKKFIDLDANLEVKNDKQENLVVDKNGMISAPSSFESLDESDLLIVPKEKVETLYEVETLDDEITLKEKEKNDNAKKAVKKEKKAPETFINENPMGGVVFKERTINYEESPMFDEFKKDNKKEEVVTNGFKQEIKTVQTPYSGELYNINNVNYVNKKKAPVGLILLLILVLAGGVAFYIGNNTLSCSIDEEDSGIKATTTIKKYYLYDKAYMSKHTIIYDFKELEDVDVNAFAKRMETTHKDKKNLKVEVSGKKVTITFMKYIKGLDSKGYIKDKKISKENGLVCK